VALTPEEKRRFLKALEEDEEFRMAVAGTIGLGGILEELKRLREDFEKWIKMEKKRWEAANKRFARIETTLGAIAGSVQPVRLGGAERGDKRAGGGRA